MITKISRNQWYERIGKHRRVLAKQLISSDEFAGKAVDDLLCLQPGDLARFVGELEQQEIEFIDQYMENIRKADFEPFPTAFLSPRDDIEETKRELRSRYIAINDLIQEANCSK